MPIVGAALRLTVGRALARIPVEYNRLRRAPLVHLVDPPTGQIGKSGEIIRPGQPLRLEATHLAGKGSLTHRRATADRPAHRRVVVQTTGVVHVLVPGETADTGWRSKPTSRWRPFLPVRTAASASAPVSVRLST